jgi:hypothetical protein
LTKGANIPAETTGPPEDQGENRTRQMEGLMANPTGTKVISGTGEAVDPAPNTIWTNPSPSTTSYTYYDQSSVNVRVYPPSQPLVCID